MTIYGLCKIGNSVTWEFTLICHYLEEEILSENCHAYDKATTINHTSDVYLLKQALSLCNVKAIQHNTHTQSIV